MHAQDGGTLMSEQILLPTTVVGSYPQPDWLIDRENLRKRVPTRVRAREMWRIASPWLEQAQDDATIVAIHDMERAGVDIISDGEIRRESYSNRFATALGGVDPERPGQGLTRRGTPDIVPLVNGPIRRQGPVEVRDLTFLRTHTGRKVKITLPGPFTMSQQAQNTHYPDEESLAMDYAAAVNEEIKDLFAAGADVVQIDEPYMQAWPDKARKFAVKALNRALQGVTGITVVHLCFGDRTVETPNVVADRIRAALEVVPPERLVIAPDCGMKYLPRDVAFGKLKAMVEGARIVFH